jgi:tetratricopeptide (TPR) repeat protein
MPSRNSSHSLPLTQLVTLGAWCLLVLTVALSPSTSYAQNPRKKTVAPADGTSYASSNDAVEAALAFYTLKEFAKGQDAVAQALKLAPHDEARVKIYRSLLRAYTTAPEWEYKVTALEFMIEKSEQAAERSLARSELVGFVYQRGKTNDVIKRYEERLQKEPNHEATLYILSELYTQSKENPKRAAELLEKLSQVQKASGKELSVLESAKLAREYVKTKKFKEGAELFEQTAARDADLAAWHFKDAAAAWLKAGDKTKAISAAKSSAASKGEKRGEQLEYFWLRSLGDTFLDAGEPKLAIPHFEKALEKTRIDGYLKDTEQRLSEALKESKK